MKTEIPPEITATAEQIKTQNNRCTANPAFQVLVQERIGPLLPELCDDGELMFHDGENAATYYKDTPDPHEWQRLLALHMEGELPESFTAGGYTTRWKVVQTCFTEAGCRRYLKLDGHNLRHYFGTQIYADSFNRNPEMIELRKFLLATAEIKEEPEAELTWGETTWCGECLDNTPTLISKHRRGRWLYAQRCTECGEAKPTSVPRHPLRPEDNETTTKQQR